MSRITRILAFCVAAAAVIPKSLWSQEPQHLNIDLTRQNRTVGTLPFDEPIRVIGLVPAYVDTVEPFRTAGRGALGRSCTPEEMESAGETWVRVNPHRPDSMAPDTFDLVLKALRPDRTYLLCLRTAGGIPDTMLTRLQRRIAAGVDTILRGIPVENGQVRGLRGDEAQIILNRFATSLPPLKSPQEWDTRRTPIFRGDIDDTTRIKELIRIRTPLVDRAAAITNLQLAAGRLKVGLRQLGARHEAPLRRLLNVVSATDTIAGWHVASAPGMLGALRLLLRTSDSHVTVLEEETLDRVAQGLVPASDSSIVPLLDELTPLHAIWTAEEAAALLGRIRETRQSLEGLRSLVSIIAISPHAQQRTGISNTAALALARVLDEISPDLLSLHYEARKLHDAAVSRDRSVLAAVTGLSVTDAGQVPVLTSTVAVDFTARAKRYISPDLGVAYAPELGEAVPYLGVTFFPLGLNRNVPQRGFRPLHSSFGVMLGLTAASLAKADERKDLFGSSSLLFGGTVRFLDVFRASLGGVALRQLNPGTLSPDAPVRVTYFGAVSFDLDVKSLFGGIGSILSGGR